MFSSNADSILLCVNTKTDLHRQIERDIPQVNIHIGLPSEQVIDSFLEQHGLLCCIFDDLFPLGGYHLILCGPLWFFLKKIVCLHFLVKKIVCFSGGEKKKVCCFILVKKKSLFHLIIFSNKLLFY